jgi:hypothetical protein
MLIDGIEHDFGKGMGHAIPSDVPHDGRAGPEGCLVVDVFCPVRNDLVAAATAAQRLAP